MKVLAFDLSTKTGWALFEDEELKDKGLTSVFVKDFNVNQRPEKSESYPYNIVDSANKMAANVYGICIIKKPDLVVIENTVKGRNRHTQRILEFIHKAVLDKLRGEFNIQYLDPSEWRSILSLRMTDEDKKNNRLVSSGKKRGKITKKHLSVRLVNEMFGLSLKIKDNDIADAICLGKAACEKEL